MNKILLNLPDNIVNWVRMNLVRKNPRFIEIVRIEAMTGQWTSQNQVLFTNFPVDESRELLERYLVNLYARQSTSVADYEKKIQDHVDRWVSVYDELFKQEELR